MLVFLAVGISIAILLFAIVYNIASVIQIDNRRARVESLVALIGNAIVLATILYTYSH